MNPALILTLFESAYVGLKATKTGITLSANNPIPDELVKRLALTSRKDIGP
ncbi:hypothetical protein [Arthrobacter sp. B0490]|uniref:hypothetical protein n=1 Tax=Arthrobacter sp. B0490 TaxID=2058891 RepID=UPI0015E3F5FC|nr:hypothetical protein [Arthrobacter sp. B0490]